MLRYGGYGIGPPQPLFPVADRRASVLLLLPVEKFLEVLKLEKNYESFRIILESKPTRDFKKTIKCFRRTKEERKESATTAAAATVCVGAGWKESFEIAKKKNMKIFKLSLDPSSPTRELYHE